MYLIKYSEAKHWNTREFLVHNLRFSNKFNESYCKKLSDLNGTCSSLPQTKQSNKCPYDMQQITKPFSSNNFQKNMDENKYKNFHLFIFIKNVKNFSTEFLL